MGCLPNDYLWFVFGDDDTVFFHENLVKTLSKYDHELPYFIGSNSESFIQNRFFSFSMAFGGAGFAISYPLAKTLAKVLDSCLDRYHHLYGSDGRISSCLAELGVGITREPGFHQMDMSGDPFGVLAAHPNGTVGISSPSRLLGPDLPKMTNRDAMRHLYKAAELDPHRILQQTVCYDRWFSWTISISWGYAVEVFGSHILLPDVLRVPATFRPWRKGGVLHTLFSFDMREHNKDPCRRPVAFHMNKTILEGDQTVSIYKIVERANCTSNLGSPRGIEMIKVHALKFNLDMKQVNTSLLMNYGHKNKLSIIFFFFVLFLTILKQIPKSGLFLP
ncbi:putative N-acetylgalactosaminide beta-1,3-galactosyltransferase [Helianthus annuus]|nr:putative N-acetylgalactosaminide beta-1,3-galactosyltransferase [Helianthus annuus]